MPNMMKLLKQAADMQKNMQKLQEELAAKTVEFSSGGGMVIATARGDGSIERVRIDPKVVDPSDVEMLEDLIVSAVDGAIREAKDMAAQQMSQLTAGLNIPGLG